MEGIHGIIQPAIQSLEPVARKLAQLIAVIRSLQKEGGTRFIAVRFGNVSWQQRRRVSGVNQSFRSTTTIIPDSCWNLFFFFLCRFCLSP
jgi:hypothetical protein